MTTAAQPGADHWWGRLSAPRLLTAGAVIVGWIGVYFAFRGHWLGVALPLGTSGLALAALHRGYAIAQRRRVVLTEALDATAARNRELDRLRHLAATLLAGTELPRLAHEVAVAIAELLEAEIGLVTLASEDRTELRIVAVSDPDAGVVGRTLPVDGSLTGWVFRHDEPLISDSMEADPRSYPVPEVGALHTAAIVPLRSGGTVIGTVGAHNRRDGRPFSQHDVRLLQTLGDQVVVGLDRARQLEAIQRSERELFAKNQELERAMRLKSEFLANMSHELRTPLNAIIGFSDLLLTGSVGELTPQQQEFVESVVRNGRHLLGLINSVLDLSKIEAARMTLVLERTDIGQVIRDAVADTASLRSAKRQRCEVRLADDDLIVYADADRVRQVLFNLLSNASKFTGEDGVITVAATRATAPLPVPAERAGDEPQSVPREAVWVSVMDTGIGISREDLSKLFVAFSQVDSSPSRRQQGTGLGLALSRRFVEMHGGIIGADSLPGYGTAVWFFLPADGPIRRPPGTSPTA